MSALERFFCGILAGLGAVAPASLQSAQQGLSVSARTVSLFAGSPSGGRPVGASALFDTWVEHLPGADFSESVYADFSMVEQGPERTVIGRFIRDNLRHVYVSYIVTVVWLPARHSLQVAFSDTIAPPTVSLPTRENWKVTSPTSYPVPQIIRWGDEIRVPLFDADYGVQLIDYVQFAPKDKIEPRVSAPRDSYAEDAQFTVNEPRLRVNGVVQQPIALPATLQATILWIYAPGYGRYVLAYSPHPEFGLDRIGEVSSTHMIFELAGNLFRLDCADRIAPGGGVYNVYGLRDPLWEPADPKDRGWFMIGTSLGLQTALGRSFTRR